ncbi:MAG: hypothetical protein LBS50_00985 [Prevotellaceae bacterium]|jgi:hypothetical protein|nr:hypothetical protein [Prevotellaceae bacterium]
MKKYIFRIFLLVQYTFICFTAVNGQDIVKDHLGIPQLPELISEGKYTTINQHIYTEIGYFGDSVGSTWIDCLVLEQLPEICFTWGESLFKYNLQENDILLFSTRKRDNTLALLNNMLDTVDLFRFGGYGENVLVKVSETGEYYVDCYMFGGSNDSSFNYTSVRVGTIENLVVRNILEEIISTHYNNQPADAPFQTNNDEILEQLLTLTITGIDSYGEEIELQNTADCWNINGNSATYTPKTGFAGLGVDVSTSPTLKSTILVSDVIVFHTITSYNDGNGTVTPNKNTATQGETIVLTITPNDNYTLNTLSVMKESGGLIDITDNLFVMPNSNVTVSAIFQEIEAGVPQTSASPLLVFASERTITVQNAVGEVQVLDISGRIAAQGAGAGEYAVQQAGAYFVKADGAVRKVIVK